MNRCTGRHDINKIMLETALNTIQSLDQIVDHVNHVIYSNHTSLVDVVYREYVHSALVYQKYLMRLRELIIFEPWRENYHFSQPS